MESSLPRCLKCGNSMHIVRYRCDQCDLTVEGQFPIPPLARLPLAGQAFVAAFVRVHGNIKKMEALFAISYPTVKNRLNDLSRQLDTHLQAPDDPGRILERLAQGEITVEQALENLRAPE